MKINHILKLNAVCCALFLIAISHLPQVVKAGTTKQNLINENKRIESDIDNQQLNTCSGKYVKGGVHLLTDFGRLYEGIGIADSLSWKNTNLIQMVIDSVGKIGGGIIEIPAGTYCLNGEPRKNCISINYDNITIRGAGMTKTRICTNNVYDSVKKGRRTGIRIFGTKDRKNPRTGITLQDFELDGGAGWTGNYDWYNSDPDGWDITHKGIMVSLNDNVDKITLQNLHVHSYRGEILYSGGLSGGQIIVKGCKMHDTNGSCFNLFGAKLLVDSTELSGPTRFWVELQARSSHSMYPSSEVSFTNCTFKDAVGAHGIAICQGDNTTVSHSFVNNTFSNAPKGLFLFTGGIAGPVTISGNRIYNCGGDTLNGNGYLLDFWWGGNTENPKNNRWIKNITFSNNIIEDSGYLLSLRGSYDGIPMVVENINISNNRISGQESENPEKTPSVVYGESVSWHDKSINNCQVSHVKIENNTFRNCAAPRQIGKILGERPLFSNNSYINSSNTLNCIINKSNPVISPKCELIHVNTPDKICIAELDTANYPNNQVVKISGGSLTNQIKFVTTAKTYQIRKELRLNGKKELSFRFDADQGKWMEVRE